METATGSVYLVCAEVGYKRLRNRRELRGIEAPIHVRRIPTMVDLKTVRLYATAVEAHVARLALEQAGIRVFVEDENQPEGDGLSWPADGVKVRVLSADLGRAAEVLWKVGGKT